MSSILAKNTLYLTVASVGQKLLSFAYFLLLARIMMPENTGAYFIALSLITVFLVVADAGVTSVVIRDVARRPEEAVGLVRHALGLKIPAAALAVLGSLVAAWVLGYEPSVRMLVLLASGILVADSFSLFFYGVLRGFHLLSYESLGMFVGQLMTLVIGGAVLLLSPSLPLLVLALVAGSVFNLILSAVKARSRLGGGAFMPIWNHRASLKLLGAAFPFFLAAIFVKLYSYLDVQFLKLFWGTAVVGIYSVAYKFTYAFQFLPLAFVAALYPRMSMLVGKDPEQLSRLFDKAMWYMLLLATPISFGLWAIAPSAIALAGSDYATAIPVLQSLIFVLIPTFLDFPIGSLLNAAGRQGTKTALFGATMVVNALLNALLIPKLGMMGAAYASIASISFLFFSGLWFVPQIIPGYRAARLLITAFPILASGIIMAVATVAVDRYLGYLVAIPAAASVYVIALFSMRAVKKEDLTSLVSVFRRQQTTYAEIAPHDA